MRDIATTIADCTDLHTFVLQCVCYLEQHTNELEGLEPLTATANFFNHAWRASLFKGWRSSLICFSNMDELRQHIFRMEQTLESMKGRMDKIELATSTGLANILSEMHTMKNTFQELMLEMRDDTIKLAGPPAKMSQWVEEMAKKMEDSQDEPDQDGEETLELTVDDRLFEEPDQQPKQEPGQKRDKEPEGNPEKLELNEEAGENLQLALRGSAAKRARHE